MSWFVFFFILCFFNLYSFDFLLKKIFIFMQIKLGIALFCAIYRLTINFIHCIFIFLIFTLTKQSWSNYAQILLQPLIFFIKKNLFLYKSLKKLIANEPPNKKIETLRPRLGPFQNRLLDFHNSNRKVLLVLINWGLLKWAWPNG